MQASAPSFPKTALKVALSAAFLAAVFAWIEPAGLAGRFRRIDWALLSLAMALNMAIQVTNAWKIRLLFPEPRPGFRGTVAVNFIAVFFTTFVPGGVGGEVARWAYLGSESGSRGRAMAAILMDRITGLWAQIILVVIAGAGMARGAHGWATAAGVGLLAAAASLWAGLRGYRGIIALARRIAAWSGRRRGAASAGSSAGEASPENLAGALEGLLASRRRFPLVAALSLGNQLLVLACFLLLDRSIGGTLAWDQALVVLFLFTVATLLPITLGNWGLSEGTLGLLYKYGGAGGETGVMVSLLFRLMAVPAALLGWTFFLFRRPAPADPAAEPSTGNRNQEVFGAAGTVRRYASLQDLFPAEKALLDRLAPDLPRAHLLDLGVGGGRTTAHLASRVARYLGADYAPAMVEACRARFPALPPEAFAVADARALPAAWTSAFDVVLFSYNGLDFLDHGERLASLREIARVLKPGGWFAFSSHNLAAVSRDLERGLSGGWDRALDVAAFRLLNKDAAAIAKGPYGILRDRGNKARARNYYIRPEAQEEQLREAGFDPVATWPASGSGRGRKGPHGHSLGLQAFGDAAQASDDRWIHYLARRRA